MYKQPKHIPVMLKEVLEYLNIQNSKTYIDGTFGNGGYTDAILNYKDTKVIAFDRDTNVIQTANEFKTKYKDRFTFFNEKFSNIYKTLKANNINKVDGLVLDIGVSSMQIDNKDRGFSFRFNSDLNMTMGLNTINAIDTINELTEKELKEIFYKYGEEPLSNKIAKFIVKKRQLSKITTTDELKKIIIEAAGEYKSQKSIPRIFQAIRIYVNDELNELSKVLNDSENFLNPNSRLVVVDFHSLEDRIVKNFIKEKTSNIKNNSRYIPNTQQNFLFKTITKNAILPSDEEILNNNRARSAKLRTIEKI